MALAIIRHLIFIPLRAESGLLGGTSASLSPGWVCCLKVDRGEEEDLKKKAYKPIGTAENWWWNCAFLNTGTSVFLHTGQM